MKRTSLLFLPASLTCFLLFCQCGPKPESGQKKVTIVEQEKEQEVPAQDSSLAKKEPVPYQSDITCPACGHTKTEALPTEVCLIKYTCTQCKTDLYPKEGDCCVFCSYGNVKCPSKQ